MTMWKTFTLSMHRLFTHKENEISDVKFILVFKYWCIRTPHWIGCFRKEKMVKICCIGAGYVGGPTMAINKVKDIHKNFLIDNKQMKIAFF